LWKILPSTAGLHYWRSTSKAEVDFVVARGDQIIGVEVKAGNLGRPNVPRSARSFIEGYQPKKFFIVSKDIVATYRIGATEIRWLGPPDVAAAVAELLR
jgi:predicted AAA+ superfamily ATPase